MSSGEEDMMSSGSDDDASTPDLLSNVLAPPASRPTPPPTSPSFVVSGVNDPVSMNGVYTRNDAAQPMLWSHEDGTFEITKVGPHWIIGQIGPDGESRKKMQCIYAPTDEEPPSTSIATLLVLSHTHVF